VTDDTGDTPPVRIIAGRYRLTEFIGQGGMAHVWRAYDPGLNRWVAVKLMKLPPSPLAGIPGADAGDAESLDTRRQRFLREVKTSAAIDHVGIATVYDAGDDAGQLYIVMQLLDGAELESLIGESTDAGEPLPVGWAAALGAQVASVLVTVHEAGVVHRDIKPRNLMITSGGVLKVLDFGVAALKGSGDAPKLTQVGMTIGTPPYMAPEQVLANLVGPATDTYALACVLYETLTGHTPFLESNHQSLQYQHVHRQAPRLRDIRSDVPKELDDLVAAMLAKEAEARPDANTVYEALLPLIDPPDGPKKLSLDPRTPFHRPFGATREVSLTRPATTSVRRYSEAFLEQVEADDIRDRAGDLAEDGQFGLAADILIGAIGRADVDTARGLRLALANVHFVAGQFSEAIALFEHLVAEYSNPATENPELARQCRYLAAQCYVEMGNNTLALRGFAAYIAVEPEADDKDHIIAYLDALNQRAYLLTSSGHLADANQAFDELRTATIRFDGPDSQYLPGIDAAIARLRRYAADETSSEA
jgi:serine/threonine protein kinase